MQTETVISEKIQQLALTFNVTTDERSKRELVASALVDPTVDDYIHEHKEGWVGPYGPFARVLARVMYAL